MKRAIAFLLLLVLPVSAQPEVTVASKKFTENVLLGELATLLVQATGTPARHRAELGGTRVLFSALTSAAIDVYPEYTGTITKEILQSEDIPDHTALRAALAARGLGLTAPLGFENTYALGLLRQTAAEHSLSTLSDLARRPELRLAFSNEFLDREDGWPALSAAYGLPHDDVRGLDHDLAYKGLTSHDIDIIDVYTTDAEILQHDLLLLEDDLEFFPRYDAVLLYRLDLPADVVSALERLAGRIDVAAMREMNRRARIERVSEAQVAADFAREQLDLRAVVRTRSLLSRVGLRTRQHLTLVILAMLAGCALALPLGVAAARRPRLAPVILGCVGVIQTIPALALLVFMIPFLGIYEPPAIAALFLYSLLPMVRGIFTGLEQIGPALSESGLALGLGSWQRLWRIELPLASPSIMAGIKTSSILVIGFATLGALIGAGGYGQPILTGIRLDDTSLVLEGAIPAALLALVVQYLFGMLEHIVVPRGLRLQRGA
jgi:osmoprotectant transport system permease protein